MATRIKFEYKGTPYTLEYNRKIVKRMASNGFSLELIEQNPMEGIPRLFQGAFQANHKNMPINRVEEIYELFPDKEELVKTLAIMFNEPLEFLVEEPDESVKINWVRED